MVVAVGIEFTVGLVVFFLKTDQVGEGEAIMAGDEIDTVIGGPAIFLVKAILWGWFPYILGQAGRSWI